MDKDTEREIFDLFKGFLDSIDFEYHYEDSDGNVIDYPEKTTSKTSDSARYNAPKTEVKEDKKSAEVIDALKKLLSEKYKEINELKKTVEALRKNNKQLTIAYEGDRDSIEKIVEDAKIHKDLLRKKLYADGYRLVGEIKSYIEFARECRMFDDVNFTDPFKAMQKTLNDFYAVRSNRFCP